MSGRIRIAEDLPAPTQAAGEAAQAPPPRPPPAALPPEPAPPPPPAEEPREVPQEEETDAPPKLEGPPPETQDEFQKRLARENREKWEARREAEQWRQRAQEYERQRTQQGAPPDAAVEQAKQQLRLEQQQQDFNRQCNEVYRKGQAEYADFDDAVRALNAVGWGNRPDALAMLTSLPDAHRAYRALAENLDNAGRVLSLPPMQMAIELARMSHTAAPPNPAATPPAATQNGPGPLPPLTQAPAPIRPVGGTTRGPDRPLDKVSMAEFIRRRDREETLSRIKR